MTRTIQLIQLLHATLLCHPELYKIKRGDSNDEKLGKILFSKIVDSLESIMVRIHNRMPEDMMESLYDEQRNTQVLLNAVLDMSPEQTIEVIKAFKESGVIK